MGSISIRNVDGQLAKKLKQQAKASKKSVNQLVLDILKRHLGLEKEKRYTSRTMIWTCSSGAGQRTILNKSRGR